MAARPILVVDDDEDTCAVLSDVLTDFGYEVDSAHNGREALEKAPRRHYQLALLDYSMPDMIGTELFTHLQAYGVEAILITAHSTPDVAEEAAAAGMRALIPKPLDIFRLLPLVEEVVGKPD